MRYLLDTNVISESVKTRPNESVLTLLEKHQDEIALAAPVWHELTFGCERLPISPKRKLIETFLNDVIRPNMVILPYDERAARWHAIERARLVGLGLTPPFIDGQIAAVSIVNDLILVTRNVQDYKVFNEVEIENWHTQQI
jgi:tRNA(fMet)-specific endonuclease VapC